MASIGMKGKLSWPWRHRHTSHVLSTKWRVASHFFLVISVAIHETKGI